ncbi:MAG: DUF192 domain-containing protein [Candidatus Dormibacteria bacterium]
MSLVTLTASSANGRQVPVQLPDGLTHRVAVPKGVFSRFMGLMGRAALDPEEGLWLVPCRGIQRFRLEH